MSGIKHPCAWMVLCDQVILMLAIIISLRRYHDIYIHYTRWVTLSVSIIHSCTAFPLNGDYDPIRQHINFIADHNVTFIYSIRPTCFNFPFSQGLTCPSQDPPTDTHTHATPLTFWFIISTVAKCRKRWSYRCWHACRSITLDQFANLCMRDHNSKPTGSACDINIKPYIMSTKSSIQGVGWETDLRSICSAHQDGWPARLRYCKLHAYGGQSINLRPISQLVLCTLLLINVHNYAYYNQWQKLAYWYTEHWGFMPGKK